MFAITKILEKLFSNLIYQGSKDPATLYDQIMRDILNIQLCLQNEENQRIIEPLIEQLI
jgi:hypothetical protein